MSKKNYLAIFAKSFNWAGFFLPKNTYHDCSKLYAFCRVLDDMADEKDSLELKIERFNEIKNFFKKNYEQNNNDEKELDQKEHTLIVNDMIILADNNNIKRIILDDLIDGVESDLKPKVHLRTVKDLLVYSYKVAGTVGLMMAKILNVQKKNALKSAIDLGIAMQLTNISRDVVEDSKNNRFYIFHNFESIKETLETADKFYESSFASIKEIPLNFRFSILVARRIYKHIGHNILKKKNIENYNNSGKIFVSNAGKIIQTILSVYDLLRLLLINQKDHIRDKEHQIINEEINLNERF